MCLLIIFLYLYHQQLATLATNVVVIIDYLFHIKEKKSYKTKDQNLVSNR